MTLQQLHYYCAVAKELNISKAAEKLHISPQALSAQIGKLEDEYHVQLFERMPRLAFTFAGEQMMKYACEMLEREKNISGCMADIKGNEGCKVIIGTTYSLGKMLLPKILPAYLKMYPKYQIELAVDKNVVIEQLLLDGDIDVAICPSAAFNPGIVTELIAKDRAHVVVPQKTMVRLFQNRYQEMAAKFQKKIDMEYFKDEPFIMPPANTLLRNIAEEYFCHHHFSPTILFELADLGIRLALICRDMGLTVSFKAWTFNNMNTYSDQDGGLAYFFPMDFPDNQNENRYGVVIGHRRNSYLNVGVRNFIALVKETLKE